MMLIPPSASDMESETLRMLVTVRGGRRLFEGGGKDAARSYLCTACALGILRGNCRVEGCIGGF